ncbi:C40 family peptidase [Paracoccus methylovorus]|uniref:C40 family peptidase n=1 Tax=Paracoccus methylovorus TaxID=2812658 RepID=A0ABX7JQF8_9RHOB|nr:NlpC/P60 family protein [Paracoccus methylovorus]QRZ15553.1 C40 family peptidase [Paracoccus methylovorus]
MSGAAVVAPHAASDARPADPRSVIAAARGWLGTPYHDQASVKGVGCDCLGLARGIWREVVGSETLPVPPYSRDWGEIGSREVLAENAGRVMIRIDPAEAGPGAVVLFRMRAGAIVKHVGILTGEGTFVHSYERLGVIEEPLTTAWRRRIAFAFLFPRPVRALHKKKT